MTNDIFTTEDAAILERKGVLAVERIVGVADRLLPAHRDPRRHQREPRRPRRPRGAVRARPGAARERRRQPHRHVLPGAGRRADLRASTSPAATRCRARAGPASPSSDLLVVNKIDLAPMVGADLEVMRRDALASAASARRCSCRCARTRWPRRSPTGSSTSCRTRRVRARERPASSPSPTARRCGPAAPRCGRHPPLTLRDTADGLYLVASGAGPVGGDDLHLDVDVRSRRLARGPLGGGVDGAARPVGPAVVAPGAGARCEGSLRWEPEPTILVAGCDHRATTTIDLAAGATLVWREEVGARPPRRADGLAPPAPARRPGRRAAAAHRAARRPALARGRRACRHRRCARGHVAARRGTHEPTVPDGTDGAVMRLAEDAWLVTALSGRRDQPRAAGDAPTAPDR